MDSPKTYIYVRPAGSKEVYMYIIHQDMWIQLQNCPYENCALVVKNNCLLSVGGRTTSNIPTDKLFHLQADEWKEQFPSMNTARYCPALTAPQYYLIAIGGHGQFGHPIASVEVLNYHNNTWIPLGDLPHPPRYPSATLCGEQLFVLSGWGDDEGYCCSLGELFTSNGSPHALTWTPIPLPPVYFSTIAALFGVPVVVGGKVRGKGTYSSTIYSLSDGQWVECCHLSESRHCCLAASLSTSNIFVVVGGIAPTGRSATVELCTAELSSDV